MMRFVIMAAGMGSRLGKDMPKCLIPIADACLIDYQLALLPMDCDVRIVVGYQEKEVMAHVAKRWPNVTFVRNPAFATTSNTHSLMLAAQHISGPFVAIDGDLIIDPVSFDQFLRECETATSSLIGVVPLASEEAVGAEVDDGLVVKFHRLGGLSTAQCTMEWCGIAYINGIKISDNRRFVFEELAQHLPLPAVEIACAEIDTPLDLENALEAIRNSAIALKQLPEANPHR